MISNEKVSYYRIRCTCDRPNIHYDKKLHVICCRNCFAKLEPAIDRSDQITYWKNTANKAENDIATIRKKMTFFVIGLARNGAFRARDPEPPKQPVDDSAYLDTIRRLEKSNDDLRNRLNRAEAEIGDLNSTIDHLKADEKRKSSVDVHGAMESILEYMCDVETAPKRKDTLDKLERYLRNLTENTVMKLEGRGITVTTQDPGSSVSGPVEVTDRVATADPDLDGKVESNERFGCEFRDDAYPRIANSVRVFHYKDVKASKD